MWLVDHWSSKFDFHSSGKLDRKIKSEPKLDTCHSAAGRLFGTCRFHGLFIFKKSEPNFKNELVSWEFISMYMDERRKVELRVTKVRSNTKFSEMSASQLIVGKENRRVIDSFLLVPIIPIIHYEGVRVERVRMSFPFLFFLSARSKKDIGNLQHSETFQSVFCD